MSPNSEILDPHPDDWLTASRIDSVRSQILPALPLLEGSHLLEELVRFWILSQIRGECVTQLSMDQNFTDTEAKLFWARHLWAHRLESLYLRKKSSLDLITYSLLRVNSQNLALELYYRIKANEDSFDRLCFKYSVGPERYKGGRIERQSTADFPRSMQSKFLNMQPGELHQPVRFGSDYAIIQVLEYIPACFDTATEDRLLMWEFDDWISGMTEVVLSQLQSSG